MANCFRSHNGIPNYFARSNDEDDFFHEVIFHSIAIKLIRITAGISGGGGYLAPSQDGIFQVQRGF